MANIPFLLNLDSGPPFYNHDMFPNGLYRRQHPRIHDRLDMHTLALIARLGSHAHLGAKQGEMNVLSHSADGKEGFEVHLDVGHFQPESLSVKVVNHCVVVEGKHAEREDEYGYISRHFVRRYSLPKEYDVGKVVSTLSTEGVLTIKAPKPELGDNKDERVVPITQTGPSDLFLKNGNKPNESNAEK